MNEVQFISDEEIAKRVQGSASTTLQPTLPFLEGASAVMSAQELTSLSTSSWKQAGKQIGDQLRRMQGLGIDVPVEMIPDPITMGQPAYQTNVSGQVDKWINSSLDFIKANEDKILAYRNTAGGPPDPTLKTKEEIQADIKSRVAEAEMLASRAGGLSRFAGGTAAFFEDPFTLASLPIAAVGGEALLTRAAAEAASFAIPTAIGGVASMEAKQRADIPTSYGDVAKETLAAGLMGAAFPVARAGLGVVGKALAETKTGKSVAAGAETLGQVVRAPGQALEVTRDYFGTPRAERMTNLLESYRQAVKDGRIRTTPQLQEAEIAVEDFLASTEVGLSARHEAIQLAATDAALDVIRAVDAPAREAALSRLQERARAWLWESAKIKEESDATLSHVTDIAKRSGLLDGNIKPEAITFKRIEGGVELSVGDKAIRLSNDELVRGELKPEAVRKAIAAKFEETKSAAARAQQSFDYANAFVSRLNGDDIGKAKGVPFRSRKEARKALQEMGEPGFSIVSLDKAGKRWVLRAEEGADFIEVAGSLERQKAQISSAVEANLRNPKPHVVDRPLDSPIERYKIEDTHQQDIERLNALAESRPDLRVEIEYGNENLSGTMREVLDRLDAEERELTSTIDCLLG